jgi:hypothetical protein
MISVFNEETILGYKRLQNGHQGVYIKIANFGYVFIASSIVSEVNIKTPSFLGK